MDYIVDIRISGHQTQLNIFFWKGNTISFGIITAVIGINRLPKIIA